MHTAERCVQNERLERNKMLVHDGAAKFLMHWSYATAHY